MNHKPPRPQIKVCGLTRVDEALGCEELGAHAIGLVFYPKSPRHVEKNQARGIAACLDVSTRKIGVFVNETYDRMMSLSDHCGLTGVQLHGSESRELVERLKTNGLLVLKALFDQGKPSFKDAGAYDPSGFIVECGAGKLPGGNARAWDWAKARVLIKKHPVILAGGLTPGNVMTAMADGSPDAVDVSSGVESAPGRKDLNKVSSFVRTVNEYEANRRIKVIF